MKDHAGTESRSRLAMFVMDYDHVALMTIRESLPEIVKVPTTSLWSEAETWTETYQGFVTASKENSKTRVGFVQVRHGSRSNALRATLNRLTIRSNGRR